MKKLTFLFALLCASVMGWAIDWTDTSTNPYVPDNDVYQIAGFTGSSVVNVQTNWGHQGIYVTFPHALTSCSLGEEGCHIDGAGLLMYLTAFTEEETEVTVIDNNSTNYVFTVHNNTAGGGDSEPIDWSDAVTNPFVPGSSVYQIAGFTGSSVVNVQTNWGHEGIYVTFPHALTSCSLGEEGCHIDGAGLLMYLTALTAEETEVTVVDGNSTNYVFTVHNNTAGGGDQEPEAIDWSTVDFVSGSTQFKVWAVLEANRPNVVNIQQPGWSEEQGIYMSFPSADQLACSLPCAKQGTGLLIYLSNFRGSEETEVTVTWNGGSKTFYVYNNVPMTLPAAKATTPAVTASRVRAVYSQYEYNTGMVMAGWSSGMTKTDVRVDNRRFPAFTFGNYLGLGYGTINVSNMNKIHLDVWTENSFTVDFYLIGTGESSVNLSLTGGQWNSFDLALSDFTPDKSAVKEFKFAGASVADQTIFVDNVYFYADADLPNPDPSEQSDTNFALRTNGSIAYGSTLYGENFPAKSIDGDNGTLWETIYDTDPQTFMVDFGQRRIFNIVKIYWGNQYASEFYLETSINGTDWTEVKHVTGNTTNHANSEQSFELDANATARYIRFRGIVRANGYGYTIKEFSTILSGTPVLTSVDISSNKTIAKVGEYATLTVAPKDQNESAIAAELSYTVSPVDAGHVTEGKYYPQKYANATITVTAEAGGAQVSNSVQVWGVVSDNLALNNALDGVGTWYNTDTPAKAVDGIDNDAKNVWQGSTTNGNINDSKIYDAWCVIDLKGNYNLQLIRIHFEGACSDAYKLYGSINNEDWTELYSYAYPSPGDGDRIYPHTDWLSTADLNNADNVRYLKFKSTRSATQWGVKIYELEVYGTEASNVKTVSASVNPASTGSVTVMAGDPLVAVTEVASGTPVTFTATPASGYDFVNWTKGDEVVSTEAEYSTTITSNTALVANFDVHRDVYCHTEVMTDDDRTLYLSCSQVSAGVYRIRIDGSTEARINGRNNFNFVINHTTNYSNDPYDEGTGLGWKVSNEGNGYIENTFSAPDYKALTFGSHYFAIGAQGGGEFILDDNFPAATTIAWNSTCSDATAPELAAPKAVALNTTDVRLTLSATDNWGGTITYNINYKPTSAEGDGTNIQVEGASGAQITKDIEGLTTNTEYTFTITASDGSNVSAAQTCKATPAGDVNAPTNVAISAQALSDKIVRLTLSADDDYAGDITYNITYDNAGVASTSAAQGMTTTLDIAGLEADVDYHFVVVATDAANNSSAAVNASNVRTFAANLAKNQPSYAGAEAAPGNLADDSNDGDKNTRWASGGSAIHGTGADSQDWWYVDLGAVYDIKNIRMFWEGARPSKYKFFVSNDATNWTEIANILESPAYSADASKVMDYYNVIDADAQGRYLKVWGYEDTNNNWAYGISFWELEVYGTLAEDGVAPVISSFTADGASTSSVLLKATATDNFNGDLTYTFYCNDAAQGEPIVKASGVEATYTVTGLTMGMDYNFKVNVSDGVNNTMSDVVDGSPISDNAAPENVTVTSEATDYSITLTLSATDNLGGIIYYTVTCGETVKNAEALSGEEVDVTFDGLDYNTPYTFSVVAKDGSENAAAAVAHNKSTLPATYPTSAAPAPAFADASVRPVYSSAYSKDCNFADWGGSPVEKQTYGAKKMNHAATHFGIFGFGDVKVDADDELYLSVWTNENISFRVVPIIDNPQAEGNLPERGAFTQELIGGQWNVVSFTMSDFNLDGTTPSTGYTNFDKIYQIKIDQAGNQTFWLDNIYFRRHGAMNENNNAEFIAANNNEGQDITIPRTFPMTDEWYTLCLPFDLSDEQLVEAFGAGYTLATLATSEDHGSLISLNFDFVHSFEAGKAYLLRPGTAVTENPVFEGVVVKNVNPADVVATSTYMNFQGTFNTIVLDNENQRFVGPENYLYSPAEGGTNMKAFRCFFTIPQNSPLNGAPAKPARIVFGEQTATGMESVQGDNVQGTKVLMDGQLFIIREGRIYNAQGTLVK